MPATAKYKQARELLSFYLHPQVGFKAWHRGAFGGRAIPRLATLADARFLLGSRLLHLLLSHLVLLVLLLLFGFLLLAG
jgi:hypothetical protein